MSGERIVYSNKNSNLVMQLRDKGKKILQLIRKLSEIRYNSK